MRLRKSGVSAPITRYLPAGIGCAFGTYFVLTSPFRSAPLWDVWAPLAIAYTTASGAVFTYGLHRWAELAKARGIRARDVRRRVVWIGGVTILIVLGSTAKGSTWRHVALIGVSLVGATPGVGTMEGIGAVAREEPLGATRGELVVILADLQRLLQRLLAAVGSLVALSTFAIGASVVLQQALPPTAGAAETTKLPPQFVLVFGAAGSLLVALFYVPAATALQRRARRLCNDLFPLAHLDQPSDVLSVADDHHKLEQLLGVDRNIIADFQTGLVILAPILASAAATFLSGK